MYAEGMQDARHVSSTVLTLSLTITRTLLRSHFVQCLTTQMDIRAIFEYVPTRVGGGGIF